jgi:hypothetical protein
MNDYFIGSGALLTAGPQSSIAAAALHAQTDPALAAAVTAAVIDFEAGSPRELSRLVVVAAGWRRDRVAREFIAPLLERGECTLVDVIAALGTSTAAATIHLFARWLPDEILVGELGRAGIDLVAHPLESIRHAALVCGERYERWHPGMRAA